MRTIRLEATWRCEIHQEHAAEIQVNNFYQFGRCLAFQLIFLEVLVT
ncbi:MAG: hypothetical protein ACK55Z_20855 [bacterium]